ESFRRAVVAQPSHVMARLNLAEALAAAKQVQPAVDQARQALALLQALTLDVDALHFPLDYDVFRVEWERAAWNHPGQPAVEVEAKATLVRWRLHTVWGEVTNGGVHCYEPSLPRPDLPLAKARLGSALANARRHAEAMPYLRSA